MADGVNQKDKMSSSSGEDEYFSVEENSEGDDDVPVDNRQGDQQREQDDQQELVECPQQHRMRREQLQSQSGQPPVQPEHLQRRPEQLQGRPEQAQGQPSTQQQVHLPPPLQRLRPTQYLGRPIQHHTVVFLTEEDFHELQNRVGELHQLQLRFKCRIVFDEYQSPTHHVVVHCNCDRRRGQCTHAIQHDMLGYRFEPQWR